MEYTGDSFSSLVDVRLLDPIDFWREQVVPQLSEVRRMIQACNFLYRRIIVLANWAVAQPLQIYKYGVRVEDLPGITPRVRTGRFFNFARLAVDTYETSTTIVGDLETQFAAILLQLIPTPLQFFPIDMFGTELNSLHYYAETQQIDTSEFPSLGELVVEELHPYEAPRHLQARLVRQTNALALHADNVLRALHRSVNFLDAEAQWAAQTLEFMGVEHHMLAPTGAMIYPPLDRAVDTYYPVHQLGMMIDNTQYTPMAMPTYRNDAMPLSIVSPIELRDWWIERSKLAGREIRHADQRLQGMRRQRED